ncbi:hypothetical protein ACFWNN_24875 [Lentzea sp. NPDC058450]|uniref:hypothetical protein n=1 Tax=Lentzea sp. NPDC058450 TaxID=3346505 RepID=UPI003650F154
MPEDGQNGDLISARRFDRVIMPLVLAAVAAIAAFGSSFYGASLANEGSRRVQEKQVDEERKKVERDKRADVYLKFLDASTTYVDKISPLTTRCDAPPVWTEADPYPLTGLSCIMIRPEFHDARKPLHEARNAVYVYGSSNANKLADALMQTLPASEIPFPRKYDPTAYNSEDRHQAYRSFQAAICREVPPNPRNDC